MKMWIEKQSAIASSIHETMLLGCRSVTWILSCSWTSMDSMFLYRLPTGSLTPLTTHF